VKRSVTIVRFRQGRLGSLFPRPRKQTAPGGAGAEEMPPEHDSFSDEHPPTPVPEPEPPAPEPAPPAPDPEPPTPEPGPPPPQLRSVPQPEPPPAPEPAGAEAPDPVVHLPWDGGEPREWNVWELERLAREGESRDPKRDEELAFLLLALRQFANANGELPVGFDLVVRESFGELLFALV
jgi:hypothetical protein